MSSEVKPAVNPTIETKPNEVPAIPKDWADLGAVTGFSPRAAKSLRLFIVGPSGEGKTTFLNSIPDNIILDFDDGAYACPGAKSTRIIIPDYDRMEMVIDKLVTDSKAGKRRWNRVTFDTIDEMVGAVQKQLEREKQVDDITEFGSQGHGYNLILGRIWSKVRELEEAGYTWAFCGHLKIKTERNPVTKQEESKLRVATYPSVAKRILTRSDFKLTVYSMPRTVDQIEEKKLPGGRTIKAKVGAKTVTDYFLETRTTAARENKSRGVPGLAEKLSLPLVGGWDVFEASYDKAVADARTLEA